MEFLKEFISEELYGQLTKELEGKEVKLANLKSGDYVSVAKHNAVVADLKTVQADLAQRDTDLEELKKSMPEDKTEEIQSLQTKYKEDTEKLEAKLKQNKVDSVVQLAIAKSGAKDDVAVLAHLKDFVEKAALDENTNTIVGLDEKLTTLQKEKNYLFEDGDAGGQSSGRAPSEVEAEQVSAAFGNNEK